MEKLPYEIISFVHSFLPDHELSSINVCGQNTTMVKYIPSYALVCKEWLKIWKDNMASDHFKAIHAINTCHISHLREIKRMLLSHLGFNLTILTCLRNEMFSILDVFMTSKYLDADHPVWKNGRTICKREGLTASIQYLDENKLGVE